MSAMRTLTRFLGVLSLVGGTLLPGMVQAAAESDDPLKLTLHDWTGQLVTTKIMGEVLQKAGYNIEYVQADYIAQFAGLEDRRSPCRHGDLGDHRASDALDEASLATGKTVENLGETGMNAIEEWWYPALHEGEVPGPARLGGAERLRGGLLDAPRPRPRDAISAAP